jgi:hypothetical protein
MSAPHYVRATAAYVKAFTLGVVLNWRLGPDETYLSTLDVVLQEKGPAK